MAGGRYDSPSVRRALSAVLLTAGLVGAAWAYAPALDDYFVCDDFAYLNVGRAIAHAPRLLFDQRDVYQLYLGAMRRPLGNALWAGLWSAFGSNPKPYYGVLLALHLLNGLLVFALLRRRLAGNVAAAVAAALFLTAYGGRNAVCWMSNLNESLLLTVALLLLLARPRPLVAGVVVTFGCLIKETIAPVYLVLFAYSAWSFGLDRRGRREWAAGAALLVLYAAWRWLGKSAGDYGQAGLGLHALRSWPALVTAAFTSDIAPVFVDRVLQLPQLWEPCCWLVTAGLIVLAVRGRLPERWLALWVLVQPLPYTLLPSVTPRALPSHYLYAASVPAMALVACGLRALLNRYRGTTLVLTPLLLAVLLAGWSHWCLERIRYDQRTHWADASARLRRDFAVLDAAGLPAGAHIVLVITPDQTPAGGAWWGWEGYPVVSRRSVTLERLNAWPTTPLPTGSALFGYDRERGPYRVGQ